MNLTYDFFADINLSDPFFDSLKADYAEFPEWFKRKRDNQAYVMRDEANSICAFLYLKIESEALNDLDPPLPKGRRLKVGTMKIDAHGTRLGERFVKKIFDHALSSSVDEIYVTVFEKHETLASLFKKYGFLRYGTKTTANGAEAVLVKSFGKRHSDIVANYPIVYFDNARIFLLSLYPIWHTKLLPDSILKNEDSSILEDVSHTNSIHKVYLAKMKGLPVLKRGDIIIIYRTSDNAGPAEYRSVITSICVIEEYRHISTFASKEDFMAYTKSYSIFTEREISDFWEKRKYPHVIRFTYNFALPKRLTRGTLISDHGLDRDEYWGFMEITPSQFRSILTASKFNEGLVVH